MRIALALLSVVFVFVLGCGRAAAPVAAAKVAGWTPAITNSLKLQIRPTTFIPSPETATNRFTNHIVWEFKFAEFKEERIESHGFKAMFGGRGEKNELVREEVERSPMVQLARGNTNVNLTLRAGGYAGIVSGFQ